mgnify:CR=1 FL=1
MKTYNVIIIDRGSSVDETEIDNVITFKTYDGALEYLCDFLTDEGYASYIDIEPIKEDIKQTGHWVDSENNVEFHLFQGEFCDW